MTKAREPVPTGALFAAYGAPSRAVFPNVRQGKKRTRLELGLVAETKRKSLPRLAQATKADSQAWHHFLAKADWSVDELRAVRRERTPQALRKRTFIFWIDHTGARQKGNTTHYPPCLDIPNVHTPADGLASANAYPVLATLP